MARGLEASHEGVLEINSAVIGAEGNAKGLLAHDGRLGRDGNWLGGPKCQVKSAKCQKEADTLFRRHLRGLPLPLGTFHLALPPCQVWSMNAISVGIARSNVLPTSS